MSTWCSAVSPCLPVWCQTDKTRDWWTVPARREAHDGAVRQPHVSHIPRLHHSCQLIRHSDYVPLVNLISIFFQIRDDYMNLQSAEYEDNKGFAEDLTEGKFSFPVVHGVRADMGDRRILSEWRPSSSLSEPSRPPT